MKKMFQKPALPVVLLLAFCCCMVSYNAGAGKGLFAQATAVATIDMSEVLENLDERAAALQSLEEMRQRILQEQETLLAEIENLDAQYESATPDQQESLEEQLVQKNLRLQAWAKVKQEQLDLEIALQMQKLYRNIQSAAAALGEARGYQLVLVDDTQQELTFNPQSRMSREEQVRSQIRNSRILYGSNQIDITDDLITRMNNAFQAGP